MDFHTVDVFTMNRFSGNPLAIVMNADDLSVAQMQTIAREFNLSETIFVQRPENPENTAKVRIFFPTAEIPFAGHPTIGCAIHLAGLAFPDTENFETEIRLEEQAGLVPVTLSASSGKVFAQLTAPVIPFVRTKAGISNELAALALGLDVSQIGFRNQLPAVHEGGPAFAFVPVAARTTLSRARPCEPYWSKMLDQAGVDSAYVYSPSERGYDARMFSPTAGIMEDPATGSASAILSSQLLEAGELQEGLNRLDLKQGDDMGRPSRIGLEIDVLDSRIAAVRIAGSSIAVSSGRIAVP